MGQPSYIPTRQALLVNWVTNFNTLITASPGTYGLVAADATTINSYVAPFTTAYGVSNRGSPGTRTPSAIAATNAAQAAMMPVIRAYSQNVRNNQGVANSDKLALGLTIPAASRTPILVPQTQPLISVVAATPGVLTMRFNDPSAGVGTTRKKPFGARATQLVWGYGAAPLTDPTIVPNHMLVTKQPFPLNLDPAQVGKLVTIWSRWYGRNTNQPGGAGFGPWSLPVTAAVYV